MKIERDENGDIYIDGIKPIQKEDWTPPVFINCRCKIIIKPEDVYFTYCTKYFVWEYTEECEENNIWWN